MEPGAELEQRADTSFRADAARTRLDDPGDQPQKRRLAGAVAPDEPHRLTAADLHRDVAERPDVGRFGLAALDEEILERAGVTGMHAEAARDALDRDLADLHAPRVEADVTVRCGRGAAAFRDVRAAGIHD